MIADAESQASELDKKLRKAELERMLAEKEAGGFTGGNYVAGAEDQRITFQGVTNLGASLGLGASATDAQIIQDLITKGKLITD